MLNSRTVLIIDDDPLVREPYRALLEAEGLGVVEANNGAEAILWFQSGTADLILLDLKMPVMDGRSFLEYRLRNSRIRSIPVLVVSSGIENGRLPEILAALGADRVLQKPVRGDELVRTVRELLTTPPSSEAPTHPEAQEAGWRHDPRVHFTIPIRVRTVSSLETHGVLRDLSAGGLGAYLSHRLQHKESITVSLDIQARSLVLPGTVCWSAEGGIGMGFHHGIQFSEKQESSFPLYTYSFFRQYAESP